MTNLFNIAGVIGRVALLLVLLVLAQSFLWIATVPASLKLGVVLLGIFAFLRPAGGPLIVAGLAPLGLVITNLWSAQPARVTEALVLSILAGYWLRSFRVHHIPPRRAAVQSATLALGAVATASCIVVLIVFQVWQDHPWPYFWRLVVFLARDYHTPPLDYRPWADYPGFAFVPATALLLEGLALFHIVVTRCHTDSTYPRQLARALAIGAIGSAALTLTNIGVELSFETIRLSDVTQALTGILNRQQSAITSKVGTAGSYFVLMAPLALGAFSRQNRTLPVGIVACSFLCVALWLTGSRVALAAAPAAALLMFPWRGALTRLRRWLSGKGLVVIPLAFVLMVLWINRMDLFASRTSTAIQFRHEITQTSMRMVAQYPLFGVGTDQYFLLSDSFSSPALLTMMTTANFTSRANAHNYFLQIAAELGLVGLGTFGWLLFAALRPTWRAYHEGQTNLFLRGTAAGVCAFLVACLAGHPLLFEIVAYPFWLALGLCAALGHDARHSFRPELPTASDTSPAVSSGMRRRQALWMPLALMSLAATIPMRMAQHTGTIDLGRVTYGFHGWETDAAGARFRWTGRRATLFAPCAPTIVELPLRSPQLDTLPSFVVDVELNGRLADEVWLERESWHRMRLIMPPCDQQKFHRIDLFVTPSWRPAKLLPGSTDPRELGVMVGEIVVGDEKAS